MSLITRDSTASIDVATAMKAPQLSGLQSGEALDVAAPCYIKASDGKVYMSNGTAANEASKVHGFASRAANQANEPVTLFGIGTRYRYATASGLTAGTPYYLGTTKGRLDTVPQVGGNQVLCWAVSDTDIVVGNFVGGIATIPKPVMELVNGAAAGNVTVTGIALGDELVAVWGSQPTTVQEEISGGAAGDHTVTGIATSDTLISVLQLDRHLDKYEQTIITGGSAGDHTVTGIATADTLLSVIYIASNATELLLAGAADLTSEFTISATDTINNTGGTDTTSGLLIVLFGDAAAGDTDLVDLTSEFTITAADTINNTGGTATTGDTLIVTYFNQSGFMTDLTSEFSVSAANTINNTGGTATTAMKLMVVYIDNA